MSVSDREWGPDHPCFHGHRLNRDYAVLGRCDKCGKKIGEPTPKWILEALDSPYKDDPRVRGPTSIRATDGGNARNSDTETEGGCNV